MITIIFGAPGSGKTSLMTHFLYDTYRKDGRTILSKCRAEIEKENKRRDVPLTIPDKPPIFANYKVSFKVGYEKMFEPYYLNPFYLGLPNGVMPTQCLPPVSKVFISEAQRYYNSRKSATMPDFVSGEYEMHRHYQLDIWMDVQRVNLIDLNIKGIAGQFIEVRGMKNQTDDAGRILRTAFSCRAFGAWSAVEQYLETGAKTFREVVYAHEGDVFQLFDSYSYFENFLPVDGGDFSMLPFVSRREAEQNGCVFYKTDEPAEYRSAAVKKGKEERKSA